MDTLTRTRETDTINSTLNASPDRPDRENTERNPSPARTRKIKKKKKQTTEAPTKNTDCDQDSDISFMEDVDEETVTSEIDEEDWIEYLKLSTDNGR